MSPYRVSVSDSLGSTMIVLAAMVVNKAGSKSIQIVEKPYISDPKLVTHQDKLNEQKQIAYSMNTKLNSTILDQYNAFKSDHGRRYVLENVKFTHDGPARETVKTDLRTLFDCQLAAMTHYCEVHGLSIDYIL